MFHIVDTVKDELLDGVLGVKLCEIHDLTDQAMEARVFKLDNLLKCEVLLDELQDVVVGPGWVGDQLGFELHDLAVHGLEPFRL